MDEYSSSKNRVRFDVKTAYIHAFKKIRYKPVILIPDHTPFKAQYNLITANQCYRLWLAESPKSFIKHQGTAILHKLAMTAVTKSATAVHHGHDKHFG